MNFVEKFLAKLKEKRLAKIDDDITRYANEAHRSWIWALVNPLENGIQKNWKYKCAYCGTEVMGADICDNQSCSQCGAQLLEQEAR